MSKRNLGWLLGIIAVSLLGLVIVANAPSRENDRDYELVRLVVDVLHEVRGRYVTEISPERERKLVEDMINGGLERLDPHSSYINNRDFKQFSRNNKGKFGGIGIQVGYDRSNRGLLTVISPMVGTPAYEAGVLAGDTIVKIDGKKTDNMRIDEAVDLIQGDPDSLITLTVVHDGGKEPVEIPIRRAIIKVQSVLGDKRKENKEWDYYLDQNSKIGYLRISSFSETASAEVKDVLVNLQKEGVKGLILDLRNNPGGLLKAAVEMSDMFLSEGKIVSTRGRNQQEEVIDARPEGTMFLPPEKYPIAVLINRNSASASEILAAALQDHNRAVVIGERSYGKGSVQNIIDLENKSSALKLTTASYWRPSGKNIHRFPDSKETDEWGVKPNLGYEIILKDEERLELLLDRSDRDVIRVKKPDAKKAEKKPFVDRVLEKAVEYINNPKEKAALDNLQPRAS
ncbi:MAG: S41 family peptidase [Planctomycetota bacterium]|jgi:carboxyl-terminal processing protease|nr:S41 family peptidase [Gemmataceae bacterium]